MFELRLRPGSYFCALPKGMDRIVTTDFGFSRMGSRPFLSVPSSLICWTKGRARAGKRRCRARTPRPVGTSAVCPEREASWSAERQFRFGPATGMAAPLEEFCPTLLSSLVSSSWLTGRVGWDKLPSTGGSMNIVKQNVDIQVTTPLRAINMSVWSQFFPGKSVIRWRECLASVENGLFRNLD